MSTGKGCWIFKCVCPAKDYPNLENAFEYKIIA